MIKNKLLQILDIIEYENIIIHSLEINDKDVVTKIDEVLGKNRFIYFKKPNEINICLVSKRKNTYYVKLYWINEVLKYKNLK
jgi:hypothetical protein